MKKSSRRLFGVDKRKKKKIMKKTNRLCESHFCTAAHLPANWIMAIAFHLPPLAILHPLSYNLFVIFHYFANCHCRCTGTSLQDKARRHLTPVTSFPSVLRQQLRRLDFLIGFDLKRKKKKKKLETAEGEKNPRETDEGKNIILRQSFDKKVVLRNILIE